MNTYKITNITNQLGKRDTNFNMSLDIEYIENRAKKIFQLKSGESLVISVPASLPLSIHRLRLKKLITVTETNNVIKSEGKKSTTVKNDKPIKVETNVNTKKVITKKKPNKH